MLIQIAAQLSADVVLISEPLKNPGHWLWTKEGRAAIWVTKHNNLRNWEDGNLEEEDFAAVRMGNNIIISIYFSPSLSSAKFSARIKKLTEFIRKEKEKEERL